MGLILHRPFMNKTRHSKDAISEGLKQDFLLHATTTHPAAVKALQSAPVVFKRLKELKSKYTSRPPGYNLHPPKSNSQLLTIKPLVFAKSDYPKI